MDKLKFQPGKTTTEDGREAIIHLTDGPDPTYPIVASIKLSIGVKGWFAHSFDLNGDSETNVISIVPNVEPESRTRWIVWRENDIIETFRFCPMVNLTNKCVKRVVLTEGEFDD